MTELRSDKARTPAQALLIPEPVPILQFYLPGWVCLLVCQEGTVLAALPALRARKRGSSGPEKAGRVWQTVTVVWGSFTEGPERSYLPMRGG